MPRESDPSCPRSSSYLSGPIFHQTKNIKPERRRRTMKHSLMATAGMAVTFAALALAGCSGGGSSTTAAAGGGGDVGGGGGTAVTGLTVASKVSVVDAKSSGTSKLVALRIAALVPAAS